MGNLDLENGIIVYIIIDIDLREKYNLNCGRNTSWLA